jgi:hypothetical protein
MIKPSIHRAERHAARAARLKQPLPAATLHEGLPEPVAAVATESLHSGGLPV